MQNWISRGGEGEGTGEASEAIARLTGAKQKSKHVLGHKHKVREALETGREPYD